MMSDVTLVCRAAEVLEDEAARMVEVDSYGERGDATYRFKVKHWSLQLRGRLFDFKNGTLLIIVGRLVNDSKGDTVIVCEKIEYLDSGIRKIETL